MARPSQKQRAGRREAAACRLDSQGTQETRGASGEKPATAYIILEAGCYIPILQLDKPRPGGTGRCSNLCKAIWKSPGPGGPSLGQRLGEKNLRALRAILGNNGALRWPEVGGPFEGPCLSPSSHRHRAEAQRLKSPSIGSPAASSTRRLGLRSPRSSAGEPVCLLPRVVPARTYFFLQGLAGGLLQLDTRVDLFHGTGFP